MRWSKLKHSVESRFADSVAGRVELRLTNYRHAHDGHGRGWITIDGKEVASMCYWRAQPVGEYAPEPGMITRYHLDGKLDADYTNDSGLMTPHVFCETLVRYLSTSIEDALLSPNYLTRALAMLDKRLGKRRLELLSVGEGEHELVKLFHGFRCSAEGMAMGVDV